MNVSERPFGSLEPELVRVGQAPGDYDLVWTDTAGDEVARHPFKAAELDALMGLLEREGWLSEWIAEKSDYGDALPDWLMDALG